MFTLELRTKDLKCFCFSPAELQLLHKLVVFLLKFGVLVLQIKDALLLVDYFPHQFLIPIFAHNVIPVQFLQLLAVLSDFLFLGLFFPSLKYDSLLVNHVLYLQLLFKLVSLLLLQQQTEVVGKMTGFIVIL
jgi:hypothetical protein